ncbi:DUF3320 domain-containing protein [Olivibacter sp. CPCC 100613]|uniref:DUF3320 domain-containing protein n=1 Tax=Olivibacter sp. CPCC 100613 TaxID=3079931 RepID=UPI002FF842DC
MKETVLARLESARKELLDLGLRNPLLNYRTPKSRGLHIVKEKSTVIYEVLVKQGKAMSFLSVPEKGSREDIEDTLSLPMEPRAETQENAYLDTKLQTDEFINRLQTRLLNTFYAARTSIEEQGVNTLYLALGMLHWFETHQPEDVRYAPLILVPVSLERSSAQERFRLRYTASEIGANLSLQAKMRSDFHIVIPDMEDMEDFVVDNYFDAVEKSVRGQSNWKVDRDHIELGFFSFGKFMIYHDLDCNQWPAENQPPNQALLQALFTEGFKDAAPTANEEHDLDIYPEAAKIFHVMDADSSQLLALLAVNEGRNMVIQGPPGTGKSQTITNMIANAIGQGKKVLFVAEKLAALEVVKRRLDTIDLGEACIELHSHKSNKKELHEELRRILDLGRPTLTHLEREVSLLDDYKEELNAYCRAINTLVEKSELTPHKIIGHLLAIQDATDAVKLPKILLDDLSVWDAERMRKAEAFAERVQARLQEVGIPIELLFWGSNLEVLLPHAYDEVRTLLQESKKATEDLLYHGRKLGEDIGAPLIPKSTDDIRLLIDFFGVAGSAPRLDGVDVLSQKWITKQEDIHEFIEAGERLSTIYKQYEQRLLPEAWEHDVLALRQSLMAHGTKWYRFLISDYRKSTKQLAALCHAALPDDLAMKLDYVNAILEVKRLRKNLLVYQSLAEEIFGGAWKQEKSDFAAITSIATFLSQIHQAIVEEKYPVYLLSYLRDYAGPQVAYNHKKMLTDLLEQQYGKLQEVLQRLAYDDQKKFERGLLAEDFSVQLDLLDRWDKGFVEINDTIAWNNLVRQAEELDLKKVTLIAQFWPEAKDHLKTALQKTWYELLIEQVMFNEPALRKFEKNTHEETLSKFKKLDLLNQQYHRALVALKHWENIPRQEAGGQVNILRTEFNKKARHMPIRRLMQEAGLAIQAIKPVFMMSPLSIANFLPPSSVEFDLVIFDEASQVRPVEALGAILRAKQLVVVGDSKQLPPTSFFDTMNSDLEDEENVTADVQSILGLCDGQGAPQSMLRWHYRSRHESLITLSNQAFYENKLVVFPSPGSTFDMGLKFHYLQDALYDRGKTRTNPVEAEAVADAVMLHAAEHPYRTLGVVAFSSSQMQAIQIALEIRRRRQPEMEGFFKSHAHEPFFIKNLENVQGDERDVIFISVGYGRSEDDTLMMNFGPLNNDGGERRLNVLITRAKMRCEVFTNITAEDIDLNRSNKSGILTLKRFLHFAQHGSLDMSPASESMIKTPFEDIVKNSLEQAGYDVRKQVGTAGFYLDLAVVDPKHPNRYLIGVQCDGENYANARSARDRDRLREQVLTNMGWDLYRVWSVNWYRNPTRELQALLDTIEKAQEKLLAMDIAETEQEKAFTNLMREELTEESPKTFAYYEMAQLPKTVSTLELHQQPIEKVVEWVEHIVKIEGPVHFEEMARRVVNAAGVSKLGTRMRSILTRASQLAEEKKAIRFVGNFLWGVQQDEPPIRDRNNLPAISKKIQYIAPEEIALATLQIIDRSIAILPEALFPLVSKAFGFGRLTEEVRQEIANAVSVLIVQGKVKREGDLLKPAS